jgi:hypothetical protein
MIFPLQKRMETPGPVANVEHKTQKQVYHVRTAELTSRLVTTILIPMNLEKNNQASVQASVQA